MKNRILFCFFASLFSTQSPAAPYDAASDSINISTRAIVVAPTCSAIDSGEGNHEFDLGEIPLDELTKMLTGTTNGKLPVNRRIDFRCDGAATFVNFQFNPPSNKVCKSGIKGAIWDFFCNEVENGATMGVAYKFKWLTKDGVTKDEFIYANRNFGIPESGKIQDGLFSITLSTIVWAPYKNQPAILPGHAVYNFGMTVWSP